MEGNRETLLGGIFGLAFAAMTDAVTFVKTSLLNVTNVTFSTFLLTCLSTVFFGLLGAAGGWIFKLIKFELEKLYNKRFKKK